MSADRTIREAAKAAFDFGYAMVENYRTMHAQAIDEDDPRFTGGFGVFRHYPNPATPQNNDIVTPNNDTPYSWLWLDLRAEPWVLSVPAIERYYILPFHDLYTVYAGFIGAATTGSQAGTYLVAGPRWDGESPDGIDAVIHADSDFVGCLGRTALEPGGDEAIDELRAIQRQYDPRPLSDFTGSPTPPEQPAIDWPAWDERAMTTDLGFFELVDFLLQFAPTLEEDAQTRAVLASIGVGTAGGAGTGGFTAAGLAADVARQLRAGLADGVAGLDAFAGKMTGSSGLFGTRAEMAGRYAYRNVGANKGLYGLPPAEAWYGGWLVDSDGNPPLGSTGYMIRFAADELPKVRFFWSATMYTLPERQLVDNPIDRYSIGDRTPGLVYGGDGSLTLYVGHREPAAELRGNWLPAPEGRFTVVLRAYGGDQRIVDGAYELPALRPVGTEG